MHSPASSLSVSNTCPEEVDQSKQATKLNNESEELLTAWRKKPHQVCVVKLRAPFFAPFFFFRDQTKSDHFAAHIIQTAAAKSHLHLAILQLRLALSARDNLESLFSYVEEEERNRGKSASVGFPPPFLFSPFLSFTSFDLSTASFDLFTPSCRRDEGVRSDGTGWAGRGRVGWEEREGRLTCFRKKKNPRVN